MKYYTEEHQWIELDGAVATVGITRFAADELGELSYDELPRLGKEVKGGEALCVVESVKAASDVFMPVTGVISETNTRLETEPELVNSDPEGEGWICKATGVDAAVVSGLMTAEAYQAFLKKA